MKDRGVVADIALILETDKVYRNKLRGVEELRAELNALSKKIAQVSQDEREESIKEGKRVKEQLAVREEEAKELENHVQALLVQLPNIPHEEVPAGGEENNRVLRQIGEKPAFDFPPKDHLTLGEKLGLIDIERAAKVAGSRFAYLTHDAVLLEFALVRFVLDAAVREGFVPILPPVLIRAEMMQKMGYVDTPEDLAERYYLEKEGMFLVGTAEQAVGPMHAGEIFHEKELPKRYAAFSSCFREEAGSYGKDTKGILRVHQFDKVELVSFAHPERSWEEHQFLLQFEEKLWQQLGIPYQVVQLAAGDMSRPSASTLDIEAWLPGQERYREVSSCSNTTDYQARRLNIRYRGKEGTRFVHMLNATGFPIGRTIIAILENYQQKDGSIRIPEVLQGFMGKESIA